MIKDTKEFNKSEVFKFDTSVNYVDNGIVSRMALKKESGNVTVFAFDEGQGLSEHSAPFDALVQIAEGTAEIVINRIPYLLYAGESIIMPANIPHAVNAVSKFKMILTMIKSN